MSATVVWRTWDWLSKNITKKVLSNYNNHDNNESLCNCRSKEQCPLNNNCLSSSIIYNAQITTTDNKTTPRNYIGLTKGTFKQRFNQHKITFQHRKYTNNTELSKYIWQLKDNSINFNIKWSITARARPYNNMTKRCDLCLTEKLMIIKFNSNNLLNKRSKLISKCRHGNKFYLKNIWHLPATIDFSQYIHTYCLIVSH